VEPGQDEQPIINALWRLLDAVDPEHSRRQKVREAALAASRKLAVLAPVLLLAG
jgi:hypothetical protein